MGNICMSAEAKAQEKKNAKIQSEIAADNELKKNTYKLLLLGAGESGKSTLVKQMKIIHGDGYTGNELESYKPTIHENIVLSMKAVLEAMGVIHINLGDMTNRVHVKSVLCFPGGALSVELASAVRALWKDTGVQEAFRRRNEFQLNDSAPYYFDNIERIASPNYVPTNQDVLRARVQTTGIIETSFPYQGKIYKMFDVGGQRSERRKWIECFDDVTAVIFVSALSGYDLMCSEASDVNRVHESMQLFGEICNNKFFTSTAMILFLNKTDLFSDKIMRDEYPLKKTFPGYTGAEKDPSEARKFILSQFKSLNKNPKKIIYEHYTCATDTKNITIVFGAVSDIIAKRVFDDIELM